VDDTIKVSNVLDKIQLVKNTFFEDPQAVAGMPELYASLATSLNSPQFVYISGSPFQLYPFLRGFLQDSFSASPGPLLLKNLTLTDIGSLVDFIGGGDATFDYKTEMIQRVQSQYPAKSFLAIGDSTEEDPEIYANA
jgi:phosphatidate phosphatase APP1